MAHPTQSTVLVTGGTGSFGSTMVRQLLTTGVREVRIFSRDELKQDDMRRALSDSRVRFYIGDVRDYDSVDRATRGRRLRLPRGRAEAGAVLRVLSARGGPHQHPRLRQRDRGKQRQRRAERGVPRHRQGRLSGQRHGHVQGDDGEGRAGLRAQQPHGSDDGLDGALRQRDDVARLRDPAVRRADYEPASR